MKVKYAELKIISHLLGYNSVHMNLGITSIEFLEREGLTLTRTSPSSWDLNFKSPGDELMFTIKHSDKL